MSSRANLLTKLLVPCALALLASLSCYAASPAITTTETDATADTAKQSLPNNIITNDAITDDEIAATIKALEADPNLATEKKTKILRWVSEPEKKKKKSKSSALPEWLSSMLEWFGELIGWFTETGRILVWTIAIILAAILVVWVLRYLRSRPQGAASIAALPTHVRELDIRPESLPDNLGDAAHALWRQGAHREALSLLYRGCLSRLVHSHGVAIKHSSTEGECAALAATRLEAQRYDYVAALIRTWQRAVYGGNNPDDAQLEQLCVGFAAVLDAAIDETTTSNLQGVPA